MSKRLCSLLLAFCMLLVAFPAMAKDCWYYEEHGEHDFEMVDISIPDCTTDGYYILECRQCGYSKKEITDKAYGHNWRLTDTKDSSCDEDGYLKYECTECHEEKKDVLPKESHKWEDVKVLEIATCTQTGSMRTRCRRCGISGNRILEKTDHDYGEWQISAAPTDHSMGKRVRSCRSCGKEQTDSFYPDGTLYRGMGKSESVRELQQQLADLDFLTDKVDGSYGKNTERAVKNFQSSAGLETTGIAYPQTLSALAVSWNQAVNPSASPIPSAAPASTPEAQQPANCQRIFDETGTCQMVYCEAHQLLRDTYQLLLDGANTDEKRLMILAQAREAWQRELDSLYEACIEASLPEEQAVIAFAKGTFYMSLSAQESLWNMANAAQPQLVAQMVNEMLEAQCAELCRIAGDSTNEN